MKTAAENVSDREIVQDERVSYKLAGGKEGGHQTLGKLAAYLEKI